MKNCIRLILLMERKYYQFIPTTLSVLRMNKEVKVMKILQYETPTNLLNEQEMIQFSKFIKVLVDTELPSVVLAGSNKIFVDFLWKFHFVVKTWLQTSHWKNISHLWRQLFSIFWQISNTVRVEVFLFLGFPWIKPFWYVVITVELLISQAMCHRRK